MIYNWNLLQYGVGILHSEVEVPGLESKSLSHYFYVNDSKFDMSYPIPDAVGLKIMSDQT